MTGRNAWDTTPEIEVEVAVEVPDEIIAEGLSLKVEELEAEQQQFYMVTRQHQIDRLKRQIRVLSETRGETGG